MWVMQVALAACLLATSVAYFFESGYTHHYTYWAENSMFDQHNVSMILKFQISAVNETEEGHKLHSLTVDSLVQYVKDGVLLNNPMRWDLTKTFLFVSNARGNIRLVHCHPEDHEELLVIKKAMVSVFAVHVQIEEDKDTWTYTAQDQDHLGSLSHNYTAQNTATGLKLHRKHFSSDHAFRTHEKTLHYDDQGTLRTAEASDHVMLRERRPQTKTKPSGLPGEKPHKVHVSGDFPDIEARATVKVTLDGKRPRSESTQELLFHNLTAQTLETKPKPPERYGLDTVKKNITQVFRCLIQFSQKDSENRSMCINDLRNILSNLHTEDYVRFVNDILGNRCHGNDTACEDKRLVVIDVVARLGDVTSQDLLMTHVLFREPTISEELRRVFMHCVAMEQPTESFIKSIETFCFGADGQHHGSRAMNRTQSRACLAVGSLARRSHHAGQHHTADRLVDRLETWLEEHGRGDPHISKRDTWLEETDHEDHHVSKAVLLHALGNAAMPRSRRHLMLHATPNRGHQLWRRAALDAMRRYNCTETATLMLDSMMHDDKHTVRQMALSVYVNHPRRHEVSRDRENDLMSQNYTYPAVARVKRNMFDKVLFKFKLALPTLDWKKELGSSAVGASFGIYFENGIDALFRVLNGYVDVNVHDKVWAEIHLGIIDKQWTLLLAEVCYKGRLSYNMNIVKDYTVGMMKDISSAFDHIANRIIEPMEKTANELASRYQDKDSNTPKSGFEPLANAVKALPKRTERALQSTVDLSKVAESVGGLPLVTKLQQLAARAQSLMEDVHSEATDLFANVKDAAVVALPFAEKEIRKSLNTVLDKLGEVTSAPRQVFSFIDRSKMGYQLAMQRIVEGNNIIKQATAFLSGSRSSFMNAGQELSEVAEATKNLVQRLRADLSRRKRQADLWGDIGEAVDAGLDLALDDVMSRAEAMAEHIANTTASSKELQEGFDQQALYVEVLKTSYQAFKEAIDMVKSRISALFGQKFHPKFPDQRRDCDDKCQCGYYPTECSRYGHPGVDLKLDPGWKIASPVAGLAKPAGTDAISIKPVTAGFTDYEIFLSNIRLHIALNDTGTFVDAGQNIGEPVGKNGCEDSHFHLAMKRIAPDSDRGLCYYVDPSPFLDRMQPVPKWTQECKDFTFKHIGDVVDFSKLTEGFAVVLEELKRFALDAGKRLLMKAVAALPDTGFLGPLKDIAGDIVRSIDLDPANLKNLFKDAASNMKDFFGNIGVKNFNLNGVMAMVRKMPGGLGNIPLGISLNKVTGLIGKARDLIKNPRLGNFSSLAMGGIGRLLSSRGIMSALPAALGLGNLDLPSLGQGCSGSGPESGGLDWAMNIGVNSLGSLPAFGKLGSLFGQHGSGFLFGQTSPMTAFDSGGLACPSFASALIMASGSSCVPHTDCLGIDCHITVPENDFVSGDIDFSLTVSPQQRKVTITSGERVQEVTGDGTAVVPAQLTVLSTVDLNFKVAATWEESELNVALSLQACGFGKCLTEVPVIRNLRFGPHSRRKRSFGGFLSGLTSKVTSFVSGRAGMMTALKSSACNMCPSFGNALATASGSACVPHSDCLGIDCDITFKHHLISGKIDFSLRVNPQQRKVTITADGGEQDITGDGDKTVAAEVKVLGIFDVKFKMAATWQGKELRFSLSVLACGFEHCLPEIPVIRNVRFDPESRRKRSVDDLLGPFLGNVESLPLDDATKMFSDFNLPMEDIVDQVAGIQEQITSAMEPSEDHAEPSMSSEFINPLDHKDKGTYPIKGENGELYMPFFVFKFAYPLGPVIFRMDFDAGGAFGISFDVKVQAIDSLLRTEIKPWASGKFRASMSLSIVVASAGIDLIGWVMKTGFPLTLKTNYNKQPVVSTKALEVELIPIELKLKGWVKILFFINIKRTIWHYTAPAHRGTIWEKVYRKDDQGPPRFPYCDRACGSGRRRRQIRSAGSICSVQQVKGRHPKDAAFMLEFSVEDDDSDLQLSYAIGDYPGGTNVQSWTTMRGNSLLSPAELPCGIPLHFLVKARNSQGLETIGRCSIPTFDCTFPDGRVDAAYRCSSHPSMLRSQVILFEDSQLKTSNLFHGVGYSPSSFGHEVVDWQPLTVYNSHPQPGVSGDLRFFTAPRPGRLSSTPKRSTRSGSASLCASECLKLTTCVAFIYNQYLHECELHEVTEGASATRMPDGHYQTYERLGKSYTAILRYENLPLRHGTRYYVNADVENVLGYRATLTSQGTMVDMTPPEPGPVGEVISDNVTADGCDASIIQRCEQHVPNSLNHRKIVDGPGSRTVFTGNRKGQEMPFTIENYHAAANWDGFKDEECGIHGYTWSVGTTVCGTDVASFVDPHSTIHNPDDWTYTGLAKGLHLTDGAYYVTVQAVSDIIHGGDLVTTVCHSTPFIVDTTPPDFNAVEEFLFDDSFRFLAVYYNVSDSISGVARMEFGLGKTKYDVMIRRYIPFEMRGVAGNTYLVNEEFETQDGVPAWIRLKVVNKVGLSATGSSESPILLDSTPPIPGHVMDGAELGQDLCCQMSTTQICAQWVDFHDPDSNIESYDWGVGLTPGKDDVVRFQTLSSYDKQSCVHVQLEHNVTYFSTVVANNKALNQKSANASSDGLLVDVTPPVSGTVSDGSDVTHDVDYTSETATVTTSWADFYDLESGLADYTVSVMVNDEVEKTFTGLSSSLEVFTDHSFSLQHGDSVVVELQANNRAGGKVAVATDGVTVDHTPPEMIEIGTENRTQYQQRDDVLNFAWDFQDPESGVGEYRCVVFQTFHGHKTRFWPELSDFHPISLNVTSPTEEQLRLSGLRLQNGASYNVKVTAINRAKMATAEESVGVTVDTTPPVVLGVSLAREGEEEETNDDDQVEHVDREPLWVTWSPHDTESGIKTTHVCVGPAGSSDCLSTAQLQTVDGSLPSTISFRDLNLQVSTDERKVLYQAYLVVFNGAGVASAVASSKPFLVLKANVAGFVLDGRDSEDVDFSNDKASIAISFSGFSSEACGLEGYEWGVGTSPFATDVLPYSDYGLVVDEAGNGFAQAHVMQFEGQKYYSTVRAKTGHNCHEEYIVSSSDGFTVDTTPPTVTFRVGALRQMSEDVVYQATSDHLDVLWRAEDASGVNETRMLQDVFDSTGSGSLVPAVPEEPLAITSKPSSGDSRFSALVMTDNAGNQRTSRLPPVTFDFTPPAFVGLGCSKVVSSLSSLLSCDWDTVEESHSALSGILIGLGSGPSMADLLNMTSVPRHSRKWRFDVNDILEASDVRYFYVIVRATNAAGLKTEEAVKVVNDVSPPSVDDVSIVTSPKPGFHDVKQRCQTTEDYIEVLISGMNDTESEIKSVELALGSSKGRNDVSAFRESRMVDGMYIMERLALSPAATVYVTARITNAVGLYVIVTSEAVVISPEPRLEVKDGPGDTDMDGQSELHVLQGSWSYSDPCPVLDAEWSVVELGGQSVTNFTQILDNGRQFYNDGMHLENFKTYVNYVRIRDALNRTRTAYSDGVTVLIRRPDTASVRDGLADNDIDFQQPVDTLSANWDSFGDSRSTLPSDRIIRYEAAVGTDRRLSATRSDLHAFEDVGMATNVTFYGLNLTAKTQTYYVTVRAYSAAGSYAESSSDGIKVGFSGDVTAGQVVAPEYQSSTSSVRFFWEGFDSDMVITHYYAGVGSLAPAWDNGTYDCSRFFQDHASLFDVRPLQVLEEESMAVFDHLALEHGETYYVTVVAADRMGHCSAAASRPILVDTTPPVEGHVNAVGFNADTVIFVHSPQTLEVNLDEFPDPESGVERVAVELVSSAACSPDSDPDSIHVLRSVDARNQSTVSMRNLQLREDTLYFVRVTVTNGAGLDTRATSRPVLLDASPPLPGLVRLGEDWTAADRTFQQHTDSVVGLVAVQSFQSQQDCVTQENLLSEASRKDWSSKGGAFTDECVGFDSSGLHVMVQHNPFLSGVDRGAAQYRALSWREGDYTFRLSPAVADHVVAGVSLASPALQPPFVVQNSLLPGNQSSLPCDSSAGVCLEDRNRTLAAGSMGTVTEIGTGLTFMETEGDVRLQFWAQDALQLKQTWVPLDFDPTSTAADYTLSLHKRREGGGELWEVAVLVNGQARASVSGLIFTEDFVLTVYGWNVDDYVPPVADPFNPFKAVTLLHSATLPVAERPLCSYGAPFRDVRSDVKEVWVGVSDGYNVSANVAPYTLLKSYCLPCLQSCRQICSACAGERLPDEFTVLPLSLRGLLLQAGDEAFANTSINSNGSQPSDSSNGTAVDNDAALNATKEEFRQYQLPTYYLDVRVVDHSGLETSVKSVGLIVDTSPPEFKSVRCFNPEFSKDVEVALLGNNHTVGVTWEVSEDVSDVTEVKVSLGTRPGLDDVIEKVTLDQKQDHYVFTNLSSLLKEDGMYYITIEAQNEAGLVSEAWSNFTVHTSPPDLSVVRLSVGNVTTVSVGGVRLGLMENTENLELDLDVDPALADDMDIEYYELSIGTREGRDDVFPKTIVGQKGAKKVAIVHGYVHRDEAPVKISVGDYTKKNFSTDDLPDPSANLFKMEPGRCLKQKLYGVSKAHISTSFDVMTLCIKRPEDVWLEADGKTHVLQQNGSVLSADNPATDTEALRVKVKLRKGAILAGVLTASDLTKQYGTAASAEFSPFIVRPDPLVDPASRWLKKRLVSMPGPSVFVSPVAETQFADDVTVTYHVPDYMLVPTDSLVSLVVWNPDTKEWEAPEEVCSASAQSYNSATRVVSAKLCAELFSESSVTNASSPGARRKRSASTLSSTPILTLGPRMLTVAVIMSSVPNLAPVLHNTTFTLLEDHGMYNFTLTYSDPEGDDMTFWLPQQPAHGTAKVTPEGKITYVPAPNYSGVDKIYLMGKEVLAPSTLALGVVPNVVSFTITVHITDLNDPPDIFYLHDHNDTVVKQEIAVGPTAGNGLNMTVYLDASSTTSAVLGLVVFSDVDQNDVVNYSSVTHVEAGVVFEENDVSTNDARLSDVNLTSATGISGKEISLNLSQGYSGHVTYDARVKDVAGAFSMQLTLNVFVLINPCFHGDCRPRDPQGTCYEPQRAFTFNPYLCQCDVGYEGEWCETETDECRTATCSPITDCVDLIGAYRCDPNPTKMTAIILCSLLAVLLVVFAVFKLKKRSSKVGLWSPYSTLDDDLKKPQQLTAGSPEPMETFRTVSDVRLSAVTPASSDAKTPKTKFEFMNLPLFTYKPSHNPIARSGAHPAATVFSEGKQLMTGKGEAKGKQPLKKKTAEGDVWLTDPPVTAGQGRSARKDQRQSVGQRGVELADQPAVLAMGKDVAGPAAEETAGDSHVYVSTSPPASSSSARGSVIVTGMSEVKEMTKVEL